MTDTAMPMPTPAYAGDPMKAALTLEQQRRVLALQASREALASRSIPVGSNVRGWTTGDLLVVADWILNEPVPQPVARKAGVATVPQSPFLDVPNDL